MNPSSHFPFPAFLRLCLIVLALALGSCGSDNNQQAAPTTPTTPTPGGNGNAADPVFKPGNNEAAIYYYRPDGDYTGWVLHLWNDSTCDAHAGEDTTWPNGPAVTGTDPKYGAYWKLDLKEDYGSCAYFIIHKGEDKDPNANDQRLDLGATSNPNRWVFAISAVGLFNAPTDPTVRPPSVLRAEGHWVTSDSIIWNTTEAINQLGDVRLHYSPDASLRTVAAIEANPASQQARLSRASGQAPAAVSVRAPQLTSLPRFTLSQTDAAKAKDIVRNQLVLAAHGSDGKVLRATQLQAAKVLDDLYTTGLNDADEQALGVVYSNGNVSVSVWAPTATAMSLKVYNADKSAAATHAMTRNDNTGIWSYSGTEADLDEKFYRFQPTVYHGVSDAIENYETTDPYSLSLSANGDYSQFVNLDADSTKPSGWDAHTVPAIEAPEDIAIYEAHVRDFSIRDSSVEQANRGKYLAFTDSDSAPVLHLVELQEAGMNTFHILPTYDITTVNENAGEQINLTNTIAELCAVRTTASECSDSNLQSMTIEEVLEAYAADASGSDTRIPALVQHVRGLDGFNWGYDPEHYFAPEGSYASDPDGSARIIENRQMIMALHALGYRVAADVVYNHTSTSGIHMNAILDRIVPGYYHRRDESDGSVEAVSCCEDTATEHRMFEKLMIDALVVWTRDYKIDAFRFDIMGFSPKTSMLEARRVVQEIDPDNYFYGEGWNTGGSAGGNRIFVQATQDNLAGTQIGTFNDRWRDPLRGSGLFNASPRMGDIDIIRLGMAGTLRGFELEDNSGDIKKGEAFPRASYADDPADIINYVSKHDNPTLWDQLQRTLDSDISNADRARIFRIASALPFMAQGVPFLQLGGDLMRSKSQDRNSYDAGDWYNLVDFTQMTNNWNVGLPLAQDNQNDGNCGWSCIRGLVANTNISPSSADIGLSSDVFQEFLKIRTDSPLFRLRTKQDVLDRIGFHNTGLMQQPGVIVMSIDDGVYDDVSDDLDDVDSNFDAIVVFVNGSADESSVTVKTADGFELHDDQKSSADMTVLSASFAAGTGEGTFTVPARTMAVFVKKQGSSRGAGLKPIPGAVEAKYTEALKIVNTSANDAKSNLDYNKRRGLYIGLLSTTAGTTTIRLQTDDSAHDLGFSDIGEGTGSESLSSGMGGAIAFTSKRGTYRVVLDISEDTPSLTVTLSQEIFDCSEITLADDSSTPPFTMYPDESDDMLYVRGNHSDWGTSSPFVLKYKGQNRYQAVATFNATGSVSANPEGILAVQFKLASSDGGWQTQMYARQSSGGIDTSPLSVGQTYDVEFNNAALDNNSVGLEAGSKYSFLLTFNEANPSGGSNDVVGSLLIQACE